jgi:hypothetical protein
MFDNEEIRYTANAEGLIESLLNEVMPSYDFRRNELEHRERGERDGILDRVL